MRHYWTPLMGSVPLMNHPDTNRHMPLVEGVHGFYYAVKGMTLNGLSAPYFNTRISCAPWLLKDRNLCCNITRTQSSRSI